MSVFVSGIKTGDTENLEQLIAELESELPGRQGAQVSAGATSSSSATPAAIITSTVAVEADELIFHLAMIQVSCGTVGARVRVELYHSTAAQNIYLDYTEHTASTAGTSAGLTLITTYKDISGSIPFEVYLSRASGSGTVYVARTVQTVVQFKRRT